MTGFFDRMLGRGGKEGSSSIAKSRLEVVLVHDRIDLSPERLRELKQELLAVIARYVPIDPDSVKVAVEQPDRNSSRLVAEIPFGKGKILNFTEDDYTEDDDLDGTVKKSAVDSVEADEDSAAESDSAEEKSEETADSTGDDSPSDAASSEAADSPESD